MNAKKVIGFETPDRFKGRTGYHIVVDRFYREGDEPPPIQGRILKSWDNPEANWQPEGDGIYRNNYFWGGNLRGITKKLDYIKGNYFNVLFLSPIGKSETSHHYEPEDQTQIDPWIGNWEDFRELCYQAHSRDILVVVDLVFNHMGINSHIFKEAYQNKWSQYRNWFKWDEREEPVFWSGFKDMPECNLFDENYQDYACYVAELYLKNGADGIRLDLGENFPKEFMSKFRRRVKEINQEALIVSEMWGIATHRSNYQLDGEQVDSLMNYPLADAIIRWVRYGNKEHLQWTLEQLEHYPKQVRDVLWNMLDTHDTPRAMNLLVGEKVLRNPYKGACWDIEAPWRYPEWFDTYGFREWESKNNVKCNEISREALKIASRMQYAMYGIPVVYYGTEIGMCGWKDPFNRGPYNWKSPDLELLEHFRELGKSREKHRRVFAEAAKFQTAVFDDVVKIYRANSQEECFYTEITRTELKKWLWN